MEERVVRRFLLQRRWSGTHCCWWCSLTGSEEEENGGFLVALVRVARDSSKGRCGGARTAGQPHSHHHQRPREGGSPRDGRNCEGRSSCRSSGSGLLVN